MDAIFDAYEFIFNGESSCSYGLMLYTIDGKGQSDVAFGNKASIIEARTVGRITPLHFGVNYNSSPLQFKLVFGRDTPIDRFEFERISLWLTGHQDYKWLQIVQPDLLHISYRCIITDLTPVSVGWLPYAFEASVTCDCPYAYGRKEIWRTDVDGETNFNIANLGSVREPIMPIISYSAAEGTDEISIVNNSDGGRTMSIGIPAGEHKINIDCKNGIIREAEGSYNFYRDFNMTFLRLLQGTNRLTICGDGSVAFKFRTLHNVAG